LVRKSPADELFVVMTRAVVAPLAAAAGVLLVLLAAGVLLELAALLQAASSATPTDTPSTALSRIVPARRVCTDAVIIIVSCRFALSTGVRTRRRGGLTSWP
jgi:hypothetical protein